MAVMGIKMKLKALSSSGKDGFDWLKTFREYDRDGSGSIDFEEFVLVIRNGAKITAKEVSDEALMILFRSVDKDASGCISYESEFLPWLEATTILADNMDRDIEETIRRNLRAAAYDHGGINWNRLFSSLDRDNSGEINYEEFRRAIRKGAKIKEMELAEEDLRKLYTFVDTDGDGLIQYEAEFLAWLEHRNRPGATFSTALKRAKSLDKERSKAKVLALERARSQTPTGQRPSEKIMTPTGQRPSEKSPSQMTPEKAPPQRSAIGSVQFKGQTMVSAQMIQDIKSRFKSFAIRNGQLNWRKLFEYYDINRCGEICYDEFRIAIRKDAKIGVDKLSEFKIRAIFRHIDQDNSGRIAYATEFIPWIEEEDGQDVSLRQQNTHKNEEFELAKQQTQKLKEMQLLARTNKAFKRAKMLLPVLVKWMNHILEVEAVSFKNFEDELRDGTTLNRIVAELAGADRKLAGMYTRPVGRAMCISNLDMALGIVLRFGVNVSNICTAEDFWEANRMKCARCVAEIFDAMQMRRLRRRLSAMLNEMNSVLVAMGRPLMQKTLSDPLQNRTHFLKDFEDCIRLMAILVACKAAPLEKLADMYGNPDETQMLHNGQTLNAALARAGCSRFLTDRDWATPPAWEIDPLILQLSEVWKRVQAVGQAVVPDFANFQFRDGTRIEITSEDLAEADQRSQEALKRNQDAEPPLPPLTGGARLFAIHLNKMGEIDYVWRFFDVSGNGSVSMHEFQDGARRVGFKGNVKAIFCTIDCNKSGLIEKHELEHFCDAALVPHTKQQMEDIKRLADSHPAFSKFLQLC